jgi:hypothetical protein
LIDAGAISMDEPTEQWMRQQMDMPRKTIPRVEPVIATPDIKEIIQSGGSGNQPPVPAPTPTPTPGDKSSNGGAGNIGKSPNAAG